MSEKISLTQQDEPSMSAEILAWLTEWEARTVLQQRLLQPPPKLPAGASHLQGTSGLLLDTGIEGASSPRASCGQGCSH